MALSRLKADPLVGVRELQTIVVTFLKKQPEKDILSFLSSAKRVDWKTAPAIDLLGDAKVAEFFTGLFKVHANGVMSKSKLKKALSATQSEYFRLNHSKMHDDDYIDLADERIRILAGQYRDLKKCSEHYDRTMRKATAKQKDIVDEALSVLDLDAGKQNQVLCSAIVPYIPPDTKGPGIPPDTKGPGIPLDTKGPGASKPAQDSSSGIFKRILKKRISSPKPEKVPKLEEQQEVSQVKELQKKKEEPLLFVSSSESSNELEEIPAMFAEAFNLESKKTHVEKKNVAVKNVPVEEKMRKHCEFELSKDDQDLISEAMSNNLAESSKGAKGKKSPKGAKGKKEDKKKGAEKKDSKSVGKKGKQEGLGEHKSSKRRRVKDSAYHKARNAARLAGCSPGTAKLKAREAANEAAMLFDAKVQN